MIIRHRHPVATPVEVDHPEATARRWLAKLLPEESIRYASLGFVEVASRQHQDRTYRIYRNGRQTTLHKGGRAVAAFCIHLRETAMPPTDRVIAEYFLIRGDERQYLATANMTRL